MPTMAVYNRKLTYKTQKKHSSSAFPAGGSLQPFPVKSDSLRHPVIISNAELPDRHINNILSICFEVK